MKNKVVTFFKNLFGKLSNCIVPVLPILIGAGMIKVILLVIGPSVLNIIDETNSTYLVFSFVSEAGFYFLPIFVAVSSAEEFKTNKYIAGFLGAILISPTFIELITNHTSLSIFNIPITPTLYENQIIPSILCVFVMSYIYNFFNSHITKNLNSLLTPLLTLIIMIPLTLCVIGPIGTWAGEYLIKFVMVVKDFGPIGSGILCAILPFTLIFGLGGANLSVMLLLLSTGCDPVFYFDGILFNVIIGCVCLALYIRNKDGECLAASITATIGGVSEPAMFGYVVKDIKSFIVLTFTCFITGALSGILGVKTYTFASFGIFGAVATLSENTTIIPSIICMIFGCVIGFILNFIVHSSKKKA